MNVDELIDRVSKTQRGFLDIQTTAKELLAKNEPQACFEIAMQLLGSDIHQARMLSTFLLGFTASEIKESLQILRNQVSLDFDWRVQEILAKAFDYYCSDIGYEGAIPTIESWLADETSNVRRAATEGLRVWTSRPFFNENPEVAIRLLSALKSDPSEYVRKSVGNSLRDISKSHKNLIDKEISGWDLTNSKTKQTYRLASKFLKSVSI